MWQRIGRYAGYTLLWLLALVVVLWARGGSKEYRTEQHVTAIDIDVRGHGEGLVDATLIEEWILQHNLSPIGSSLDKVDLAALEQLVESHNAVSEANAYVTHSGKLSLIVKQHKPIARLRVNHYDMYVTAEGYIFPAANSHAAFVPVITGDYQPLFEADYRGLQRSVVQDSIAVLEQEILTLEREKLQLHKNRRASRDTMRMVVADRVSKSPFRSEEEQAILVSAYEMRKADASRRYAAYSSYIDREMQMRTQQQDSRRMSQQKLRNAEADFEAMVAFVKHISEDAFWRSEVVQIVATGGGERALQLSVVPRSGRFLVDMGFTDALPAKLATLRRFYDRALSNLGWDKYRSISLRYNGQVVCR